MAGVVGPAISVIQVIGLISNAIGLISFLETNIPHVAVANPLDSYVRIAVALNGDKGVAGALRHAAGEAPLVNAFNENQHLCGQTGDFDHPYITSGSFYEMTVEQGELGPGEQATYLQIIPTTNELCIAYISQKWADLTSRGWVGDMAKGCGRDWYYSNIIVGDSHKPTCAWVDNDHSHGIVTAALQIHMQDFTNLTGNFTKDPSFYCRHPTMFFQAEASDYHWQHDHRLKKKPKNIEFWDGSDPSRTAEPTENDGVGKLRRRNRLRRRSGLSAFSHLIASRHDKHSARKLCEDAHSHGPDFFSSSEGVFCDMDAKMHWPLCNGTTTEEGDGCYHWDTHSLVLGGERQPRNYSRVEEGE